MAAETQSLGFAHFIAQTDTLGKALFVILVLMSLATWYLIIIKTISNARIRRRSHAFVEHFWNATSLDAVSHEISTHGVADPFSHLTSHALYARDHHTKFGAS